MRRLSFWSSALVLGGGDHGDQLILGDAPVAAGVEQFADALLEQAEQDGQGTQDGGEHPQEGSGHHGPAFRVFLGDGLGADLPEGEDDQGQDHGGDGGAILRAELGEEQGAQGGGGDVDNIIAHQKGGEQSVKIFSQAQGGLALRLPSSAMFRSLILFREEKAVSVAEKYAEAMTSNTSATIMPIELLSIE